MELTKKQLNALDASQKDKVQKIFREFAARREEGIGFYEPLPHLRGFHKSRAPERLIRGGNRSSKTMTAAAEFAMAVCGRDKYNKYPKQNGRAFVVGKDARHISEVLYRKLFLPGAFRIIKDLDRNVYRVFKPWLPEDEDRWEQTIPAPPLISARMAPRKNFAWESKKEQFPARLTMINGWEIRFFSSLGKPPMGSDIDLCWFDEEIVDPDWHPELSARLIDREGLFFWSATPQMGGVQYYDLLVTAQQLAEEGVENPRVEVFHAHIEKNKYISDKQRELFYQKLSDDDYRIRVLGESALETQLVYPEFNKDMHICEWFEIPPRWTRYAFIDPGRQVCAILCLAVPPPQENPDDHVYFYDEAYIRNCDAVKFASEMKRLTAGQNFYQFVIDHHGGRKADTGSGLTTEVQYSEALRQLSIQSETTGFNFHWADCDVNAGIMAFRSWLINRDGKPPKLKVLNHSCKNLLWEIERYHYKKTGGIITDKPINRNDHQMDNCRYAALHNPTYHKLSRLPALGDGVLAALRRKAERNAMRGEGQHISLGPRQRGEVSVWA